MEPNETHFLQYLTNLVKCIYFRKHISVCKNFILWRKKFFELTFIRVRPDIHPSHELLIIS